MLKDQDHLLLFSTGYLLQSWDVSSAVWKSMRGPSQVFAHVHCVQSLLNRRLSVTWKTIQTFYNFNTKWFPFSQCRFCRFKRSIPDRLFPQISFSIQNQSIVSYPLASLCDQIYLIYSWHYRVCSPRCWDWIPRCGQLEASFYLVRFQRFQRTAIENQP